MKQRSCSATVPPRANSALTSSCTKYVIRSASGGCTRPHTPSSAMITVDKSLGDSAQFTGAAACRIQVTCKSRRQFNRLLFRGVAHAAKFLHMHILLTPPKIRETGMTAPPKSVSHPQSGFVYHKTDEGCANFFCSQVRCYGGISGENVCFYGTNGYF